MFQGSLNRKPNIVGEEKSRRTHPSSSYWKSRELEDGSCSCTSSLFQLWVVLQNSQGSEKQRSRYFTGLLLGKKFPGLPCILHILGAKALLLAFVPDDLFNIFYLMTQGRRGHVCSQSNGQACASYQSQEIQSSSAQEPHLGGNSSVHRTSIWGPLSCSEKLAGQGHEHDTHTTCCAVSSKSTVSDPGVFCQKPRNSGRLRCWWASAITSQTLHDS